MMHLLYLQQPAMSMWSKFCCTFRIFKMLSNHLIKNYWKASFDPEALDDDSYQFL